MTSINHALLEAQSRGLDRLDAQLLLLHALGRSANDRAWLLAHDLDALPTAVRVIFGALAQRRAGGEPLAYITGHKEFFGLALQVDTRVLVPRPDTETLVAWALEVLEVPAPKMPEVPNPVSVRAEPVEAPSRPTLSVIDLGTGSGAVALALKHTRPDLRVSATDASADALQVARANAARLRLAIEFIQGSWLTTIEGRYHAIVSNPPYIAAQYRHLIEKAHDPLRALASGEDGLDDIRQIVLQARTHLHPGGWLLLEHGYNQAERVRALLLNTGFEEVQSRPDLSGIERCSGGRAPLA
ncbi:MAG: peptide chain release factor N(5)-glutamine methyltransferase [Rhodoferax sp.]